MARLGLLFRPARVLAFGLLVGSPSLCCAQSLGGGVGAAAGGYDYRDGDIRGQVEQAFDQSLAPAPTSGVHISGYLDGEVHATDNVRQVARGRVADFVTEVTPTIMVTSDTRRFRGNLGYYPTVQIYAKAGDLDYVDQNFNGSGQLTVLPNWLFVSGRAYGGVTSFTGQQQNSIGTGGLNGYNRNDVGFNRSFQLSPYLQHDFAGYGRLNAAYVGSYTSTGAATQPTTASQAVISSDPYSQQLLGLSRGSVGLFSSQESLDFTTGSYLGRVSDAVSATGSQESGGGVSDGSTRYTASDTVSYALFKFLSLSVTGGYESIAYSNSVPAVRINDAVWGFGVKLVDGNRGLVALSYGHHDGFDSPSLSASYNLTSRFRVYGSYAEGLATSLEEFRGQVDGSGVDSFGRSVSLVDNSPVQIANQLFGNDNNVFRSRNLSFGAALLYSRDVFTLSVRQTDGTSVSSSAGLPGFSQRTRSVQGGWHHDIGERTVMDLNVSYGELGTTGVLGSAPSGSTRSVSVSLGGTYALSETVSLRAGYQLSSFDGGRFAGSGIYGVGGGGTIQNLFYFGVRKAFQ